MTCSSTGCSAVPSWTVPVSAAAIASAGVAVRSTRLRALRAIDGSMTVQLPRSRSIGEAAGGELVHLLLGEGVTVHRQLPAEAEQLALAEECRSRSWGLALSDIGRDRSSTVAGGELATEAPRPEDVDAAADQGGDAVLEQAGELDAVERDLVGDPQLEQPVEHGPGLGRRRGVRSQRGSAPGRRSRARVRRRSTAPRRRRGAEGSARRGPGAPGAPTRRPAPPRRPRPAGRSAPAAAAPAAARRSAGSRSRQSLPRTAAGPRGRSAGGLLALARGMASATASSSARTTSSAASAASPSCARAAASRTTRSSSSAVQRPPSASSARSPAGLDLPRRDQPEPEQRRPGQQPDTGMQVVAAVRLGEHRERARIGSATVRRSSVNSTTPVARRLGGAERRRAGDGDEAHGVETSRRPPTGR